MKLQANDLKKIIKGDKLDEEAYFETMADDVKQKMHTPDVSEKRKSMAIYQSPDSKRRFKR